MLYVCMYWVRVSEGVRVKVREGGVWGCAHSHTQHTHTLSLTHNTDTHTHTHTTRRRWLQVEKDEKGAIIKPTEQASLHLLTAQGKAIKWICLMWGERGGKEGRVCVCPFHSPTLPHQPPDPTHTHAHSLTHHPPSPNLIPQHTNDTHTHERGTGKVGSSADDPPVPLEVKKAVIVVKTTRCAPLSHPPV